MEQHHTMPITLHVVTQDDDDDDDDGGKQWQGRAMIIYATQ